MNSWVRLCLLLTIPAGWLTACGDPDAKPTGDIISQLHLKSGPVITCGPPGGEFGKVAFDMSCPGKVKAGFNTAVEMLHSFEYDEAEKVFAGIIESSPECAMAYWGVAMCSFHPLWEPPSEADLEKGAKAIEIAGSVARKTGREEDYIHAVAAYYKDWEHTAPYNRNLHFEKAMELLHQKYPGDKEATIFYALALVAAADPSDKTYVNQKKAGDLLNALYQSNPNHPGIIHYIIHTYDYPGIASLALPAARRYADVAPSSAHALHMPSHIFTRLGLWDDCIRSNIRSVEAARCYAKSSGIKGHYDEEFHGLDYLMYAYLQKGDNVHAAEQLNYINAITENFPVVFKVAYAYAAIPSRMVLENKNWREAAGMVPHPANFPWQKYPWQEAIIYFTRLLGAAHTGDNAIAEAALQKLKGLYDTLLARKDAYKAKQVEIQLNTGKAWIAWMKNNKTEALRLMNLAAEMEDSTTKHPVTPGEVLPARELLADMLLQLNLPAAALQAYEKSMEKCPNRLNSLYGAAMAAEKSGNTQKAVYYFKQLTTTMDPGSDRHELSDARAYLKKHGI